MSNPSMALLWVAVLSRTCVLVECLFAQGGYGTDKYVWMRADLRSCCVRKGEFVLREVHSVCFGIQWSEVFQCRKIA